MVVFLCVTPVAVQCLARTEVSEGCRMPERTERLLWAYAPDVDEPTAHDVFQAHLQLVKAWPPGSLFAHDCVVARGRCSRVWLFRVGTGDKSAPTRLDRQLRTHLEHLKARYGIRATRRTALPTPLVSPSLPGGGGFLTDVGLHSVNDAYNGMLVTYSYWQSRGRHHVPHFQVDGLGDLLERITGQWRRVACDCFRRSGHCDVGCFDCFDLVCAKCLGTGWLHFAAWSRGGYHVDYSSGFPIATIPGAAGAFPSTETGGAE